MRLWPFSRPKSRSADGGATLQDPAEEQHLELKWETIPASELANRPTLVSDLLARRLDGVTVTGVYSEEESANAVASIAPDTWNPHYIGGYIGMALGMIHDYEPDRVRYLDEVEREWPVIVDAFGFDPHQRLAEVLAPSAEGRDPVPAREDGRSYMPGQMRFWQPGLDGLKAHVGNEFRRDHEDSGMRHLLTTTTVKDHLSYFVVLQAPDEGGVLSVYDLVWEQDDAMSDDRVDLRDDSRFDSMPCLRIAPEPGSLVLFGGGWRWHRVDPLTGSRARVTYGGFCAPSVDNTEIHFWS